MRLTQAPNSAGGAVLQVTPFPVTAGSGVATGEIAVRRPDSAVDAFTTEITTARTATSAIAAGDFLDDRNLCLTISHHRLRSVRKRDGRDAIFVELSIEQSPPVIRRVSPSVYRDRQTICYPLQRVDI
jgi:hypothetical protein